MSQSDDKPAERSPTRLLVPAYFYPAGEGLESWRRLIASSAKTPIVAIVNPDSGPGMKADDNYVRVLRLAEKSPLGLIGYVTTSYAKRPPAAVQADVERWQRLYPGLHGIFFDEQSSQAKDAPYYAEVFAHARKKFAKGIVISNPGTTCAEDYFTLGSGATICLFENNKGFDEFRLPKGLARFAARTAVLVHGVKSGDRMKQYLDLARQQKIGFVYITDAGGANPWDRLPTYWTEETALLATRP